MIANLDYKQENSNSLPLGQNFSLKPLKAQVGGHVYMKLLNESQVCKPLNQREVRFYQNIPKNLQEHVPKFLGTVQIRDDEDTLYVLELNIKISLKIMKKRRTETVAPHQNTLC